MKYLVTYILSFAILSFGPSAAGELSITNEPVAFYALTGLPTEKLNKLDSEQLSLVRGNFVEIGDVNVEIGDVHINSDINIAINLAFIIQANICAICDSVIQGNIAGSIQGVDIN